MACAKFYRDQQFALDQIRMFTNRKTKTGLYTDRQLLLDVLVFFYFVIRLHNIRSIHVDVGYFYARLNIACSVCLSVLVMTISSL